MEIYGVLGNLENNFINSKSQDDKRFTLQQKFVYVLHKKDYLMQSVKERLYNQAIQYLNDINYHSIKQVLEDYIEYYQNNMNIDIVNVL